MKVLGVIPARLQSTRFPEKVLYQYRGKPLLYYVWNEVRRSKTIGPLVIATDSLEILRAADAFGADCIRTSTRHRTGSDRVAEAAAELGGEIIVNIQADNFGVKAGVLDRVVSRMRQKSGIGFATLATRLKNDNELLDLNVVKVLTANNRTALWFSRLPVPYVRGDRNENLCRQFAYYGHIGIYFYRRRALRRYAGWSRSKYEKAESLEQLRILENGESIQVFETTMKPVSVDRPSDLEKLRDVRI